MTELGKIEKPDNKHYSGKKKLYCVRNMYLVEDAPDEYKSLFNKYWDEVAQQIEKIEVAGTIKTVFCENVDVPGEEALDILGKMNERVAQILKNMLEKGSALLPLESKEIFGPFLDWNNCLMAVRTNEVFEKIHEFYKESLDKRLQHILNVIENNLAAEETGLLIMRDEDRAKIQFPKNIEVFLVTPPSYDDIMKWFREQLKTKRDKKAFSA